ncbi:sugar ABC transporter substrate-binding protein [Xylanimonas ulmi]|uniref:Carbohydrate ABC transporter substrate-binding protein (CUT1 family) n=1 Tax=Xylanimonas ulmi TaxID=228973 RepID=A0A4Q7LZC1_9MICO|nr:extracellular solute-binding protein [Xylanibacterium ulmi]RZS60304.1 carbohydrate ABC transporter substrate-binding protein (CUT1 family) [Xylanibacterium ulmi]
MRRGILLTAAAAATLALTACGGGNGDAGDATPTPDDTAAETPAAAGALTVWVDETRLGPVQDAANAFTAETGTQVEIVQKNFEDIRTDFIAQVPTGEGPDITVGAHDWLGELTQNGVVAPIELGDKAGDFEDVAIAAFTQDGQVFGLPYAIENIALIRNTDLAPEAPATWDDAIAVATAAGTEFKVLVQTGTEGDPFHYYPLQTSFGAPVFEQNEDGSYNPVLKLGGEPGHNFANWLAEQGQAGNLSVDITSDIANEAFADGKAPFLIGGPWTLSNFEGLNISVDPIPSAGGETAAPFVGVQGFYLSAQSQNALVANDFLVNFLATEDVQTALYEAGGRPPALTAAAEAASADPIVAGFRAVGAEGVPMPSIPQMASVWAFWGVTQAQIISGQAADPAAAWDQMVSDIQGAID